MADTEHIYKLIVLLRWTSGRRWKL